MNAPIRITAEHIQTITQTYEAWLTTARELLRQLPDEPSASALDAYLLLTQGDLHRLRDTIAAKEDAQ